MTSTTQNIDNNVKHKFHILELSFWPITTSFSLMFLAIATVMLMHDYEWKKYVFSFSSIALITCCIGWWRDVIREGKANHHTKPVKQGLRLGMMLFIVSEIMFFFAFFFAYFLSSVFPAGVAEDVWNIQASTWPPENITTFDPWDLPLINTLILLLSGTTVTWAHYAIEKRNRRDTLRALLITILLGMSFTVLQIYEYSHAAFGIKDGIYAANFYLATGFHGIHVVLGTIFLAICYLRALKGDFTKGGYLGFEFAAWYWHFVDAVWILLFICIYVLGR